MNAANSRLTSEDRREQILAAASIVFGERGYSGGTTDAIAQHAGISQAYVVRMFGSKENLFRAVANRAADRVAHAFREAIASLPADADSHTKMHAMGLAYADMVADRGTLLALHHLFGLGHDETWGPLARECYLDSYRIVRDEAGLRPEEAAQFFAQGMLVTVLLAMRMPADSDDADAAELMNHAFGEKTEHVLEVARQHLAVEHARR